MAEAAEWRVSLEAALAASTGATARYVQLATVTPNGCPANRTVVFRGFLEDTNSLTFVTDARSRKVAHLALDPRAAVCWYLPECREQYRFRGTARVVKAAAFKAGDETLADARRAAWERLSPTTREQFSWPEPGAPRDPGVPVESQRPDLDRPPDTFCLLILEPGRVERLDLNPRPHRRTVFRRTTCGNWEAREVNP
ncbi:MAG: pyridoxamine 5'-phosphate oxidase family protein [Candidatus Brocadiia bacterium]